MFWDEDSLDGTLSVKVHDWAEKNIFLLNINAFIKLTNIILDIHTLITKILVLEIRFLSH